jgi:repressor LexA
MVGKRSRSPSGSVLTAAQRRVLKAISEFIAQRQFPPTVQELAELLGVRPATVHEHLGHLARKGYVRHEPRKARGLAVVREPEDELEELVPVPLVGVVAAGQPVLAEENILGEILVESSLARRGRCFALRVRGDSMVNAGIRDGHIVIVRLQPVAESGDIVVALVGGEATVKRLHIRGDRIELRPENRRYRPIVLGPEMDFQIIGKVLAVRACAGG